MKKNLTELVFLLDRSGSMAGLESDTIGGFQAMITKQKQQEGRAYVTTILFDHLTEVVHDRVELQTVPPMTEKEYFVRGSTALVDALGGAIDHVRKIHKYAREEDRPEKTLFVIITDGLENSSTRYRAEEVRRMVRQQQEQDGWEFLFLGANIDAVETARGFGISEDRAVNYHCDARGTALNYEAVGEAVSAVRACRPLGKSWKRKIDEDFKSR